MSVGIEEQRGRKGLQEKRIVRVESSQKGKKYEKRPGRTRGMAKEKKSTQSSEYKKSSTEKKKCVKASTAGKGQRIAQGREIKEEKAGKNERKYWTGRVAGGRCKPRSGWILTQEDGLYEGKQNQYQALPGEQNVGEGLRQYVLV